MLGTFATYFPVIVAATNTKRPFKTIQEVISYGKAHPGEISISTSNIGGNWWVASMAFMKGTGVEINIIPQPGAGALSMAQVAGGTRISPVSVWGRPKPCLTAARFVCWSIWARKEPLLLMTRSRP